MKMLLDTQYWLLREDDTRKLVFLKRTAVPFESPAAVVEACQRVIVLLHPVHRSYGVIVDMRDAPFRNDPAFEAGMAALRSKLTRSFPRLVLLVQSPMGVLQVNRLTRTEGGHTFVTRSESDALRFALGEEPL